MLQSGQVSTTSELCQSVFYLEAPLPEKQDSVFLRKQDEGAHPQHISTGIYFDICPV